jgi:UvrD-like helicase family protein
MDRQIAWYEDFHRWQSDEYWADMRNAAQLLEKSVSLEARELSRSLSRPVADVGSSSLANIMAALVEAAPKVDELVQKLKQETDLSIERSLRLQVNKDGEFLRQLAAFLDELASVDEEIDDAESEDEEEILAQAPRTKMAAAMAAYMRNLRGQARSRFNRRSQNRTSRAGRIAEWIGDRTLSDADLDAVGESLQTQAALRRFTNPVGRYVGGVAGRYRRYRRVRQSENLWYAAEATGGDVSPLEVDAMLLCAMGAASSLIRNREIRRNIDESAYAPLKDHMRLVRNQIMVDEATDFSPLQLACIGALSNPGIQSFFACGDFNQRITSWGTRSIDELRWAFPRIDARPIQVSYRHSRQLSQLAVDIVRLCGGGLVGVELPEHVSNEGVTPVLGVSLARREAIIAWLGQRIVEIEKLTKPLPSVAVLVNDEAEVGPIADGLAAALTGDNLNVVACYKGQFAGQENDIRVFDVQHIKGLEFEAVFFIGVDKLDELQPELFDKYLYVGATRAATYLGLTCAGDSLPQKIQPLASSLAVDWQQ